MKLKWVRSREIIGFNRPSTWLVLGVRGSGKSSQLEHVGEGYLEKDHCVLDLFGSRDGENLAWLRSPWAKEKRILLIHGDNVNVKGPCAVKNVKDVELQDFTDYDILISASPLYASVDQQFLETNKLTDLLYKRFTWNRLVYAIVREASNLYYSRLKVSDNQLVAKAAFIYMLREARHMGVALGLDTLRFYGVDIDIRSAADYTIFKSQGVHGLTNDLKWLYKYFLASLVRNMKPDQFIILTKKGGIGYGIFPEIPWHKQEKENILKACGLTIEYEAPSKVQEGTDKGIYTTVGDEEHTKIIGMFADGIGGDKIAAMIHRSSRTTKVHRDKHNKAVARVGYCSRCRRVKGQFETLRV